MGRGTVKTPEKLEMIAEYRTRLAPWKLIADALQVPENTLNTWSKTPEYKLIYAKKRLELLVTLTGKNLYSDNPKDSQWLLERLHREEYAPPKTKTEIEGGIEVVIRDLVKEKVAKGE